MAIIKITSKEYNISDDAQALQQYATITEIGSWQEVIDSYHNLKQQLAPKCIFLILDDAGQAEYTSGHAIHTNELFSCDAEQAMDEINIDDPSLNAVYYEQVVPELIAHYAKQFQNPDHKKPMGSFDEKMVFFNRDDCNAIIAVNKNPLTILDEQIIVKAGKFANEALKFALMPNGYFTCDFDPFENFAIIEALADYGFEFIGLGAAFLGFIRTADYKVENLSDLIVMLTALYHLDEDTQATLLMLFTDNNYIILPYSESPSEYF